jgi:hypothetical protein
VVSVAASLEYEDRFFGMTGEHMVVIGKRKPVAASSINT